jgi:hypothetical protein
VPIDDRHLDVHEDEVGVIGFSLGDTGLNISGLDDERGECACSWRSLPKLGSCGQLHLEGRALAERRLHPDATAVHLNDLLAMARPRPVPPLALVFELST